MPHLIEGVVSDFAQPGHKSDTPELTLGDMEEMTEKLKGMRLTYDHCHPIHSTEEVPIEKEVTVGKIVDAYIDEDECLRVRAELDDDWNGERTRKEIENKFLAGFSLGLAHQMDLDKGKFKKDLVELSITPVPEFANTSFVRFVETGDGKSMAPLRRKLGELKDVSKEYKGKVVAITASTGERDAYTKQRSSEILADLIRSTEARPLGGASARKISNTANDNSQRAAGKFRNESNQQKMSGQFNLPPAGGDAQIQAHMDGLRARQDEQANKAVASGNTYRAPMPRNGIAPIHIHNYMDGTRRGAQRAALAQQQQQQQRRQQQQPQQQGRRGQVAQPVEQQAFDDGDDFYDDGADDGGDFYDDGMDEVEPQAPPPRQRRTNARQSRPQKQHFSGGQVDDDEVPPPAPDVARRSNAPPKLIDPKTNSAAELKRIEQAQRDKFLAAGGQIDGATEGGDAAEFEKYKAFLDLKAGKRKQPAPRKQQPPQQQTKPKKSAPAPTNDDYMVLDIEAEEAADEGGDEGVGENDTIESNEAKLRRENAALRAKLAAKTQARVNSIKSKMSAPSAYDDDVDGEDNLDSTYAAATAGEFDDEEDAKNNIDLQELNKILKIDANGNSLAKEELYERIEDLKEKRKDLTAIKHRLIDARSDPKKEKLVAKLAKEQKVLEETLQKEKNALILQVRDFQSEVNVVQGQKTDPRQLEMYGKMLAKRGLVTEQDLDVLGAQVIAVSASAASMGKSLASVTERFQRERIEREKLAFQAKEQARLLGNASDTAAAHKMVLDNDAVGRSRKGHGAGTTATTTELPFFIPTKDRPAQQASENYAGYDPVTMLPAGKKRGDFTLQEQMGIQFNIKDGTKDVKQNTTLEHSWRQKKPNMYAPGIPRDAQLRVKKGLWRTGNTKMMEAISMSRAESGTQFVPNALYNHYAYSREAPPGAVKSNDGEFFVLPTVDFKTGGQ